MNDFVDLSGVGADGAVRDDEPEVQDFGSEQITLTGFTFQTSRDEFTEDALERTEQRGRVLRKNEDVVNVDDTVTADVIGENRVHETLESGGRVAEAEGHDSIDEKAFATDESRLALILWGDFYLVVAH